MAKRSHGCPHSTSCKSASLICLVSRTRFTFNWVLILKNSIQIERTVSKGERVLAKSPSKRKFQAELNLSRIRPRLGGDDSAKARISQRENRLVEVCPIERIERVDLKAQPHPFA